MKEETLKRVNSLVINYLSIVGLWEDKHLDQDNPIVKYFTANIMSSTLMTDPTKTEPILIEDAEENMNKHMMMDIPPSYFHIMIKELFDIYEKLDDINNHQNQQVKEVLIHFVGSEQGFKEYINSMMKQYKETFYDLVIHYNSQNPEYNNIRIKILGDKLSECVQEEDYLGAAKIRDKILVIKEKGK